LLLEQDSLKVKDWIRILFQKIAKTYKSHLVLIQKWLILGVGIKMNKYTDEVLADVVRRNPGQKQFHQVVQEVLGSIKPVLERHPEYEEARILEDLVKPDRRLCFKVRWKDDAGKSQVNDGYRVQFSNAVGIKYEDGIYHIYKGGLRFRPTVNLGLIMALAFEQVFKNAPIDLGGAKGGSDFDPKVHSKAEIKRFCESFVRELYKHIGPDIDVPAGDDGVKAQFLDWMDAEYRGLTGNPLSTFTGKSIENGGSYIRKEATGYGVVYFVEEMLKGANRGVIDGKRVAISGSGNVALYAAQKAIELGGIVITVADSNGTAYFPKGMSSNDWGELRYQKEVEEKRLSQYAEGRAGCEYKEGTQPWDIEDIAYDIALPCATENEVNLERAKRMIKNGCTVVAEGGNMSSTPEAVELFQAGGILYGPPKAANVGGVATSGDEMRQNRLGQVWTPDHVDARLRATIKEVYAGDREAAEEYGLPISSLVDGANIAGFVKVADAMKDQGLV